MDSRAKMLPINVVPVPRVAELPTFQKTLQATPPLMTATVEIAAVIRVETV
jgi:6,7-dimethyl-8-ribityllumazine synthase